MTDYTFPTTRIRRQVGARRRVLAALAATAPLAIGSAAVASTANHAIVVGRGIYGVELGQTKAQVIRRLGAPRCGCESGSVWIYNFVGYSTPPVAEVDFAQSGVVSDILASGGLTENHFTTARDVGLGSTLASIERAYRSARCYFVPGTRTRGALNGRCVIVSRFGDSDADTAFLADAGYPAVRGVVSSVSVDLLGSATAETIKLSVTPRSIPAGRKSTAKVTVVVTSPPLFDFPYGVGIAGDHVRVSSTDRGERIGRLTDHGNGTYTATITSSRSVGVAAITATDGAVSARAKLRQSQPRSSG
jgi:hypothetical protein